MLRKDEYTIEELKKNEKDFRDKRNKRRIIFFIILFMSTVMSMLESFQHPLYTAIIFICFVINEYIDRINLKAIRRKYNETPKE